MRKSKSLALSAFTLLGSILLSGCGPSLGEYVVEDVQLVGDLPPAITHSRDPQPYIRIAISSEFDLAGDTNGNIYAFMSMCPYNSDRERIIFGPLVAGPPVADLYDSREAMSRDRGGRAHYFLYVPVAEPERKVFPNRDEIAFGYNLAAEKSDVCLRITQAGYFLTSSKSQTIRIRAQAIASLLGR